MLKKCCVYNCKTNYKSEKRKRTIDAAYILDGSLAREDNLQVNIPVFRFPSEKTDSVECERWKQVVGRINANLIVNCDTVVCELYWPAGYETIKKKGHMRPKHPPSIFPGIPESIIPAPPPQHRSTQRASNQERNTFPDEISQFETLDKVDFLTLKNDIKMQEFAVPVTSFFHDGKIYLQSISYFKGIPTFLVILSESLKYEAFHFGVKCYVKILSTNRVTIVDLWSKLEEIIRFLNSKESDNKMEVLQQLVAAMGCAQVGLSVLNIICSMVFGDRYEIDDEEFLEVIEMNELLTSGFGNGDAVAFLPWLRIFPTSGLKKIRQYIDMRDRLVGKKLKEHKETFDSENIRDFTDSLIKTMEEERGVESYGRKEAIDDHLEIIISELFIAGSETTATTLRWMVTYLLHWPQYQDKVFNEIKQVVGLERYPELKDRSNLPLTQAVIQETLRLSSLVPLGVMHKVVENSTIGGINITKGALVIFNIWNIHHDPKEWEKPNDFDPHRWLNEEGKYVPGKHKSFLPFSAGRRSCLGESMAKTELFIFLSRLIRDFKIEAYSEELFPSLQGRIGITLAPKSFKVIFKSRDSI